ncbi:hypothetical protein Tco_1169606, partial [Tanacetum coccineum]
LSPDSQSQVNVPQAAETVTTSLNELDMLFSLMFDEYFTGATTVVSKSSDVTTADASDKRQQQPDSTSSTSTLATTVSADGNFDLVILFSFTVTNGNPSSVIIKQHCGRYKCRCCNPIPAKSDSLPDVHTQALKVKHSASRLLLLNKNVIGHKA